MSLIKASEIDLIISRVLPIREVFGTGSLYTNGALTRGVVALIGPFLKLHSPLQAHIYYLLFF